MVTALLAHGADPNRAQENGVTPLMTAARTGSVEVLKSLLARGARVNAVIPSTGQTALMWATSERHLDVTRELIAAGADVRSQATLGFTPLLFAARNGDVEAGKLLIAAGAGVNDRGADGTQAAAAGDCQRPGRLCPVPARTGRRSEWHHGGGRCAARRGRQCRFLAARLASRQAHVGARPEHRRPRSGSPRRHGENAAGIRRQSQRADRPQRRSWDWVSRAAGAHSTSTPWEPAT